MSKILALAAVIPAVAVASAVQRNRALRTLTIGVPIDPARLTQSTVPIRLGIARALDQRAGPDPIFVLEALGESGVEAASRGLMASLETLHRTHDLVFVDERGVSVSPLACSPIADETAAVFDPRQIAHCRHSFDRHTGLGTLNSRTFAADVEMARKKLGYRRIELIGYFYGTRIAEQYMRRWPARVSAAVLADASPLTYPAAEAESGAISASIASTLDACRADQACNAQYPDLAGEWARASALLSRQSDGAGLLEWMKHRTVRWSTAANWPRDVDSIARGRGASVLAQYAAYRRTVLATYPLALRIAVDCAENMPLRLLPKGSDSADEQAACPAWPVQRAPKPRPSTGRAIPILAVTAEFDIEAPAGAVRRAFAGNEHARVVMFPDRARATDSDWGECLGPMVTTFLQNKSANGIDTSCAMRLKRPAFTVADQ